MQNASKDIPIISFEKVSVSFQSQRVLKDISFDIPRGIIQVIVGPSGTGKTTLLKTINGLVKPDSGKLKVFGVSSAGNQTLAKLRSRIGYIPQHEGLVQSSSAIQNVLMGSLSRVSTIRSLFNIFPKKEITMAEEFMNTLGILSKRDNQVYRLSGGERKRVAIARALMQTPKLLLADEFLSDLDEANTEKIMRQIIQMKEELNLTVVMIEHNAAFALKYGDRIAQITEDGALSIRENS